MKAIFILVFLLGLSATRTESQQEPPVPNPFLRVLGNGNWWISISPDAKQNFVDGYVTAMKHANYMTHGTCMKNVKDMKPGAQFETEMKGAMDLCGIAAFLDFDLDKKQLLSGLDNFYKDEANIKIPIDFAMQFVRDQLKGDKSPNELQRELSDWRNMMNRKS